MFTLRAMVIARILFTLPLPEPFDYEVPDWLRVRPGDYVKAPLGPVERTGVVWEVVDDAARGDRDLKQVIDVYPAPPMPAAMRRFIDWTAKYVVAAPGAVLSMALRHAGGVKPSPKETVFIGTGAEPPKMTDARKRVLEAASELGPASAAELARAADVSAGVVKGLATAGALDALTRAVDQPFPPPNPNLPPMALTDEQTAAADRLKDAVAAGGFQPFLLDGVTGSGKTEVYFEAIAESLHRHPNGQVLVLLPEIALTEAVFNRFERRFGAPPCAWHSGLSEKERRRAWREAASGRTRIVIGARSALFLPYPNLKLLIVDEEHDSSFKQEDGVVYHARDLAVMRAKFEDAAIILASATPALETSVNADLGRYERLRLAARPGAARLPDIALVDMKKTPPEKGDWLSPRVVSTMAETFANGEQSLLFLNRRGYAPLVICRACGERLKTPGTESWLTEHRYTGRLVCHVTGFTMQKPARCPNCGAVDSLMGVGPGVERVAEEARKHLPEARVEIFSSDTADQGDGASDIVARMAAGEIDVLVGTQIVAKGHNFPKLTLVGVVDADAGMKGGDLRAGERTYQLLSQVAGRAGRADRPGRALIQTYKPDDPAMQALAAGDRDGFMAIEKANRELAEAPPFARFAALIVSAPTADGVDEYCVNAIKTAPNAEGVDVLGPAPAPISILRGRHRRRFLIQAPKSVDLSAYMAAWRARLKTPGGVRISIDIDPYTFL